MAATPPWYLPSSPPKPLPDKLASRKFVTYSLVMDLCETQSSWLSGVRRLPSLILPISIIILLVARTAAANEEPKEQLDTTDVFDNTWVMGAPWDAFWRPNAVDVDWGSDCRTDCGHWTDGYSGVGWSDGDGSKPTQNLLIPYTHFTLVADWKMEREEEKLGISVWRQLDRSPRYWMDRFEILCNGTGPPGHWRFGGGQLWEYKYMRTFRDHAMEFLVHGGNFCDRTFMTVWRPDKWDNLWVRYMPLGWKDNLVNFADDPRCETFGKFGNKVRCVVKYHFEEDKDEEYTEVPCQGTGCGPPLGVAMVGDDAANLDHEQWHPGPEDDCEKIGFFGTYPNGTQQWKYDWVCKQVQAGCDGGACGIGEEPKFPPPERPVLTGCEEKNITRTDTDGNEVTEAIWACDEYGEGKDDEGDKSGEQESDGEEDKNKGEGKNEGEDKDEEDEKPLLADVG